MAYVINQNVDDEERKRQEQGTPTSPGGLLGGGGSSTTQNTPAPKNTGFTNFSRYVDANKDQSLDFANKLSSSFSKEGDSVLGGINDYSSNFNKTLENNTPNTGLIQEANSDPVKFAQDDARVAALNRLASGNFTAPQFEGQEGYSDIYNKAKNLSDKAKSANTEVGRSAIIQSASPGMGTGKLKLNQALIGADKKASETLEQSVGKYRGASDLLSQKSNEANKYVQDKLMPQINSAKTEYQNQFYVPQSQNLSNLKSDILKRKNDLVSQDTLNNEYIDRLGQNISSSGAVGLNDEIANTFGFSPGSTYRDIKDYGIGRLTNHFKLDEKGNKVIQDILDRYLSYIERGEDLPAAVETGAYPGLATMIRDATLPIYNSIRDQFNTNKLLQSLLSGSSKSSGDINDADAASVDEIARVNALEKLLGDTNNLFDKNELENRGKYKRSNLAKA